MKAVAINGSPRKGGNTEILLKKVLTPLAAAGWETDLIHLGGAPIRGCRACYHCFDAKDSRCGQKDDFFNLCMEKKPHVPHVGGYRARIDVLEPRVRLGQGRGRAR